MEGGFKESEDQVLELPDDDPIAFSHFQLWLYTGNILESHECAKDIDAEVLVDIHLFGGVRGIPGLQNEAINVYIDHCEASNQIPTDQLHKIYENTRDGSPLRRLMVDMMTFDVVLTDDATWFGEGRDSMFPQQFLIDLAKSLYEDRAGTKTKITDFKVLRSRYHIQDDGKKEVSYNSHCCQHFLFNHSFLLISFTTVIASRSGGCSVYS